MRTSAVIAGLLWVLTITFGAYFWFESQAFTECLKAGCTFAYLNIVPLYLSALMGLGAIIATAVTLTRRYSEKGKAVEKTSG